MAHSYCLRLPGLIRLHAVSDTLIALAYFMIPVSLVQIVRRRRDLEFAWMFLLFGLFILSCGTTHVLSVWTLWHPVYRFDGLVKVITAVSSLVTAILLIRLAPQAIALPSPSQLRNVNDQLESEIGERRRAEVEIRNLNKQLEQRVAERDMALAALAQKVEEQQQALVHTERDVQFIMDLLPALVSYIDANGYYRRVNRTYQDWFDKPLEEIQGRHMRDVVDSAYLQRIQPYLQAVLSGKAVTFEDELPYPTGTRNVEIFYTPDFDKTGVRGFAALVTDISDRKRIEHQLQQRADLLDQAMEPLLVWELHGPIEYWNRAAEKLYGYSAEEAIGRVSHELLRTTHPLPLAQLAVTLDREHDWTGELLHYTRDGREIVVESRHHLILEQSTGRRLVLESNRDITERKRSELELRQLNETLESRVQERTRQLTEANEELQAFAYSVSHDLRAPLRSVDGFGRILLRDYPGKVLDERGIGYIQRMSAATVRMGQLIEDLLNLSQVSRTVVKKSRINLSAMAREVLVDLSLHDRNRVVDLEIQEQVHAYADPRLMRIVLENLLGNAWKFTGKTAGPEIRFGCLSSPEVIYFVRDNGAGFDMAHLDQLFAPFQRLHTAKEFEGTGIGLAIVQRIIRRHGGHVWAEGKPGSGATFFFTLDEKGTV
jgi:PAS domain S-box-containing protein